ncbi:MAG: cupin domain-containing protein [Candidatus Atribacteria bacterium]|nr:cupin domain-containing protein [Candidatus Atribacteria bacterium]
MVRKNRNTIPSKRNLEKQVDQKNFNELETVQFLSKSLFLPEEKSTSSIPFYLKENEKRNLSVCLENELKLESKDELSERSTGRKPVHINKPWGYYAIIDQGPHYKIKKIVVNPGYRLSLQVHFHRNEYWLVTRGKALVTIGDQTFFLFPNQSTYIPLQTLHRMENRGDEPLEVIEVQNGDCVSEEDIIRIEDDFNRSEII